MTKTKVLIEKFKSFEIYYDKEKERFISDKPKLDIHFEARTLWEIKGYIKESQVLEVNKYFYIKSGFFDKAIAKINLLTINNATKECKFEILEDTEDDYDVGRIKEESSLKTYKITKENTKIYEKVKKIQNQIEGLERKQKQLVENLK